MYKLGTYGNKWLRDARLLLSESSRLTVCEATRDAREISHKISRLAPHRRRYLFEYETENIDPGQKKHTAEKNPTPPGFEHGSPGAKMSVLITAQR